jgi:hypothetical protein
MKDLFETGKAMTAVSGTEKRTRGPAEIFSAETGEKRKSVYSLL